MDLILLLGREKNSLFVPALYLIYNISASQQDSASLELLQTCSSVKSLGRVGRGRPFPEEQGMLKLKTNVYWPVHVASGSRAVLDLQ